MPRPGAKPKAKPKSKSKHMYSDELMERQGITTVYGPRKTGKTTVATSVCKEFKGIKRGPHKKLITLPMLWIGADKGATNCLKSAGYRVRCEDLRTLMHDNGWSVIQALDYAQSEAAKFDGWVVLDTVSTLHRMIQKMFAGQGIDGWDLWRALMIQHQKIHDVLATECPRLIYLMHAKAVIEQTNTVKSPNARQRQIRVEAARRSPGGAAIVPMMDGQSADIYLNDSDHILALLSRTKAGKGNTSPSSIERYFATGPNKGEWEAGSRFSLVLEPEEPAHLGKLLDKANK